jgi:EAL domain-containing protein (putative c-di-GMP-specific phosphodiesterase class I)
MVKATMGERSASGRLLTFLSGRALGSVEESRIGRHSLTLFWRVVALSSGLIGLGLLLWWIPVTRDLGARAELLRLDWYVVAILTAVCEIVVQTVPVRGHRQVRAISMNELATVLGLFFATPGDLVAGRVIGVVAVMVLWRRQSPVKVFFNGSMLFAESALALLCFNLVRGSDALIGPRAWAAAYGATIGGGLLSTLAITMVVVVIGGRIDRREFLHQAGQCGLTSVWVTCLALVAVQALDANGRAAGPLLVAMVLLLVAYRSYSSLSERHLGLQRLSRFGQTVSSTSELDEILAGVLRHAREVLRADYAEIVLVSSEVGRQPVRIDSRGEPRRASLSERAASDRSWTGVVTSGAPLLIPRGDRSHRALLADRDLRDAVLVPLRGEAGIVGTILVGDRISDVRSFDTDDVRLLLTVAHHAGLALRNGQLADRNLQPDRPRINFDLREGLSAGQLEVQVQPQASARTGRVLGVEALVRWRHPRQGLLFPDLFIPIAERNGLVPQLTDLALEQAVAACASWRRAGHQITVGVNLSARGALNQNLIAGVRSLLARHRLPAEALTLEIAESSVIRDPAGARIVLDGLHELGVRLSIDGFGTGYSSLSHLHQLPVQEVRIDRGFVMNMLTEAHDLATVRSIIDLGTNLGLEVVAEGVDDAATWAELRRLGCDRLQGFHLAAPMAIEALGGWLEAREVGRG